MKLQNLILMKLKQSITGDRDISREAEMIVLCKEIKIIFLLMDFSLVFNSESLAQNDPLLKRLPNTVHLSREQQYELSMWRNIHIKQRIEELNLMDPLEIHYYRTYVFVQGH